MALLSKVQSIAGAFIMAEGLQKFIFRLPFFLAQIMGCVFGVLQLRLRGGGIVLAGFSIICAGFKILDQLPQAGFLFKPLRRRCFSPKRLNIAIPTPQPTIFSGDGLAWGKVGLGFFSQISGFSNTNPRQGGG